MQFFYHKTKNKKRDRGYALLAAIFMITVGIAFTVGYVNWSIVSLKIAQQSLNREQALQIAESGVEYYRWHLAHDEDDFCDGKGTCTGAGPFGPFVHSFYDRNDEIIGEFSLLITPPAIGSTITEIESTGTLSSNPDIDREITVRLGIPSFARYSVASDADIRFGEGTEIFGPVHSNGGIRYDGIAHNLVTSALETYNDDDGDACTNNSWAVHTCVNPDDPSPPISLPARPDVFEIGREVGVPAIDFDSITSDLALMKAQAQADGFYLGPSGRQGYHIVFNINDTVSIYQVTRQVSPQSGCYNSQNQDKWGTWSIRSNNGQTLIGTYAMPPNGVIFAEDDVWVDGQINGWKVSVGAAKFTTNQSEWKSIIVNNDLQYSNYDGTDVIGLIAQENINVGMVSDTSLRIDAAMIAQNGKVHRYYYRSGCSPYNNRNTITLYGTIGTNLRYGFAYTDGSGYATRDIIYDANLLFGPPPFFPLTTEGYQTISWKES